MERGRSSLSGPPSCRDPLRASCCLVVGLEMALSAFHVKHRPTRIDLAEKRGDRDACAEAVPAAVVDATSVCRRKSRRGAPKRRAPAAGCVPLPRPGCSCVTGSTGGSAREPVDLPTITHGTTAGESAAQKSGHVTLRRARRLRVESVANPSIRPRFGAATRSFT